MAQRRAKYAEQRGLLDTVCLWRCGLVDVTCDIVSGAACAGGVVIDRKEKVSARACRRAS